MASSRARSSFSAPRSPRSFDRPERSHSGPQRRPKRAFYQVLSTLGALEDLPPEASGEAFRDRFGHWPRGYRTGEALP